MKVLVGGILEAFEGMSVDAYCTDSGGFLSHGRHPTLKRVFRDCGYKPMVELLRYLEGNGFTNFIASGGDRDFMRTVPTTSTASRLSALPAVRTRWLC